MKTLAKLQQISLFHTKYVFLMMILTCNFAYGQDLNRYLEADQMFSELVDISLPKGEMPQLTDSVAAKVILALTNKDLLLPNKSSIVTRYKSLQDICSRTGRWHQFYLILGIPEQLKSDETQEKAFLTQLILMKNNTIKYQNEMQLFQQFIIKCSATQLPVVYEFFQGLKKEQLTTTRLEGVKQIQSGFSGIHIGIILTIQSNELKMSFRKAIIEELALNTEIFSQSFTLENRKMIVDYIIKSRALIDPELHSYLDIITKSMSNESCEKLCAVH